MAKPHQASFPWMGGGGGILLVSFNQHPLKASFISNWSCIPQYVSTEPHLVSTHWVGMPQYLSTGPPAVPVSWERAGYLLHYQIKLRIINQYGRSENQEILTQFVWTVQGGRWADGAKALDPQRVQVKGSPCWVPSSVAITVDLKEIAIWELRVKLYLWQNEDYNLGEQFLRAIWDAVSWTAVLILPQIKLNLQLSRCAFFLKLTFPFHAAMAGLQDYNGRLYFALITVDYPALTVTRPGAKHFSLKRIRKCQFGIRMTLSWKQLRGSRYGKTTLLSLVCLKAGHQLPFMKVSSPTKKGRVTLISGDGEQHRG